MGLPARKTVDQPAELEQLFDVVRDYIDRSCDKKFGEILRYLPSGDQHRQQQAELIVREVGRLLEHQRRQIEDDVDALAEARVKFEALEARLLILESRSQ